MQIEKLISKQLKKLGKYISQALIREINSKLRTSRKERKVGRRGRSRGGFVKVWTKQNCSVPDCPKPARAKGLCIAHYQSERYHLQHPEAATRKGITKPGRAKHFRIEKTIRVAKTYKICHMPECNTKAIAKGLCPKHYSAMTYHQKQGHDISIYEREGKKHDG